MLSLGVKLLSRLSKPVAEKEYSLVENLEQARAAIKQLIPDPDNTIRGKVVLDFGSGEGWHAIVFGELGARCVTGIEIDPDKVERSRQRARLRKLDDRVIFNTSVPETCCSACDVILSRDSMEHYQDPESVLRLMRQSLRPGGVLIISFGPTWYSPYGAHMNFFTPLPWVHLFFSEKCIMTVRSRFRSDGAYRYADVPGGLNRMSVARFERLIRKCDLRVLQMQPHCIRGRNWLGKIPFIREFFINAIVCRLERPIEVMKGVCVQ